MPKGFTRERVADVNGNYGALNGADGVGQCDGGMAECPAVDHNTTRTESNFVEPVNEFPFVVALRISQLKSGELLVQLFKFFFKGLLSVNTGFPNP